MGTFEDQTLRAICDVLGDTSDGLTGGEISRLLAAIHPPDDRNRSVNRWGTQTQWIYRYTTSRGPTYVYTDNEIVTSWQD